MWLAECSAPYFGETVNCMAERDVITSPTYGRRILVADTHRDSRESLAQFLTVQGHSVRTAGDGIEALIEAGKFLPDIAFLDLNMPRMNGFELCARLRADTSTQDSALFALAAGGADTHIAERASVRFDAYLCKPVELGLVEALVNATKAERRAGDPSTF
jgi:CheY-like chemotaxis protein